MINFDHNQLVELVMNRIDISQVTFGSIKLGAGIDSIDIKEINDIYVVDPSKDGYNFENSNFTITERLEQLLKFDGWIHLAGGLACRIEKRVIADFRITKRYMEKISCFSKEEIIRFHGKPDYALEDENPWDMGLDNYILCYENKRINFYLDPETGTLKEIYTAHLDKS